MEQNSSHFNIEKSMDGRTWDSISSIQTSVNGSHEKFYSFGDNYRFIGVNYYRLVSVDFD